MLKIFNFKKCADSTINTLMIKTLLNIAACNLKTRMFESALKACDEVLKLEKNNITALYRRARAIAL